MEPLDLDLLLPRIIVLIVGRGQYEFSGINSIIAALKIVDLCSVKGDI